MAAAKCKLETETLIESVNASAGINELLLTGEERVALGADFDLDIALGGAGLNHIAAVAGDGALFKIRMNSFLHFSFTSFGLFANTAAHQFL